jgi:SAM-dependent methyltransferase
MTAQAERAVILQRAEYRPAFPVEEFIIPLLRSHIEQTLTELRCSSSGASALDVGCGGQPFRGALEAAGYSYTSVDVQDARGVVDYIAQIDQALPEKLLQRAPFDLVFCTEVLEHVADWPSAFSNFAVLAKPQGYLLVTCPHFYVLHEVPYDFWRPTIHALEHHAAAFGFEPVKLKMLGTSWDVLGTLVGANLGTAAAVNARFGNRCLAWLVNRLSRAVFLLLKTRALHNRVTWGSSLLPVYLSNLALFQKSG